MRGEERAGLRVRLGLVVTSDRVYRGVKPDEVTPLVEEAAIRHGFDLVFKTVVPNDAASIARAVVSAVRVSDVVLVTGGTGVSPRDITVDVVRSLADVELPGFGEAHRRASEASVGLRSVMSRATAFTLDRSLVVVSPGSPDAVRVSLSIIAGIAPHAVEQLRGAQH